MQQGKKKSCGCLRSDMCRERAAINTSNRTLPGDAGSFNQLYASYKWQAAKRGLSFELSKDDFRRLVSGTCVYCGALPSQRYRARPTTENFIYNGVDRVNNATGYTIENSVSCCGICNDMKRHRSKEEFLEQCSAITEYMNFKMQAEMSCGGQMAD
ncbi:MAG: hypothetical protein ACREQ5_08675 [Candidatus Dormibacteria bacterium]